MTLVALVIHTGYAGDLYVNPNRIGDKGALQLGKTPHLFYKEEINLNYFALKSVETGKYIRSAGGNNIVCDRDKVGSDEQFRISDGGIFCTTHGNNDRWFDDHQKVRHFVDKKYLGNKFEAVDGASIVAVSGYWQTVEERENNTDHDLTFDVSITVGTERSWSEETSVNKAIEAEIEKGIVTATASLEYSKNEAYSMIQTKSKTVEYSVTVVPGKKLLVQQYIVHASVQNYLETVDFDKVKYETQDL